MRLNIRPFNHVCGFSTQVRSGDQKGMLHHRKAKPENLALWIGQGQTYLRSGCASIAG